MQPAIELAEEGWQVSASMATRWRDKPHYYETTSLQEKLAVTPEAGRIYLKPDGTTRDAGDRLRNPDCGRTLQRLARDGPQDFYLGEMARAMTSDLEAHQSWITSEDLSRYRIRDEAPVVVTYRDLLIHTAPAPHGGTTLAAILNILEGYDLVRLGHNSPAYIHLVSMAMKAAFADRNRTLGDPHFVEVPQEWLVSKDRARQWREVIDAGEGNQPLPGPDRVCRHDPPQRGRPLGKPGCPDSFPGHLLRGDHARFGLHVQQFHDQLPPLCRPPQQHSGRQRTHHGHDPDHRLQGGETRSWCWGRPAPLGSSPPCSR